MLAWSLWRWALWGALKSITLYLLLGHQREALWTCDSNKPFIKNLSLFTCYTFSSFPTFFLKQHFQCLIWRRVRCKESLNESSALRSLGLSSLILPFCSLWHWHWPNLLTVSPWGTVDFTGPRSCQVLCAGWRLWLDTNYSICLWRKC